MSGTTYHLAPERGWLNDPNGMVRHEGRWHVFFQHNPAGPFHDAIAWGHASSPDLLGWELHPLAFGPTPGGPDALGCWSGCWLPGLGRPAVAYSGVARQPPHATVCVRQGSQDLMTWSGPQVVAEVPAQVEVMRDPFVLEHGGRRLAVLGAGLPGGEPALLLYDVSSPLRWDYLGVWLRGSEPVLAQAGPADVWECPQLVPVEDRWVLLLSLHDRGELGPVVACVGDLVDGGGTPRFVPERVDVLDGGSCFYAPQAALDGEAAPWVMGWARQEAQDPTVADRAGCLTLPRRLVLRDAGAALELDPRVAAALGPGRAVPVHGDQVLRGAVVVTVGARADGPGPAPAVLSHPDLGRVELVAGTQVWVDADLVEVYPGDGSSASTWRHERAWTLRPAPGAAVLTQAVPERMRTPSVPPVSRPGARAAAPPGPAPRGPRRS